MQLIGDAWGPLDVALLPIGDNYTMGIDDAVRAAGFLKAKVSIPMHYDTFDLIKADPAEFVRKAKAKGHNADGGCAGRHVQGRVAAGGPAADNSGTAGYERCGDSREVPGLPAAVAESFSARSGAICSCLKKTNASSHPMSAIRRAQAVSSPGS